MLGRGVADRLASEPPDAFLAPEVVAFAQEADRFILNLECCVSERGEPWPDPRKPFFFRAPPAAIDLLIHLGVDCVTLANNHALDFGPHALVDTLELLGSAGIAHVGAGTDVASARATVVLDAGGSRLEVVGLADHPGDFAAGLDRPGIAHANLADGVPPWATEAIARSTVDVTLVTPHWGPNMTADPVSPVRRAARSLVDAGATLVAGHSAHVFHGVGGPVLFDLGDFLDDYAVDPRLRNDLGLLWRVTLDRTGPTFLEALPLRLDYCHTSVATGDDAGWIVRRFRDACGALGTEVAMEDGLLTITWEHAARGDRDDRPVERSTPAPPAPPGPDRSLP
jgi:hypothetical protein